MSQTRVASLLIAQDGVQHQVRKALCLYTSHLGILCIPLDKWLRGPLREKLLDYSSYEFLKEQSIFDAAYVSKMIRSYIETGDGGPATGANYSKLSWSFFVFQQWYEAYHAKR